MKLDTIFGCGPSFTSQKMKKDLTLLVQGDTTVESIEFKKEGQTHVHMLFPAKTEAPQKKNADFFCAYPTKNTDKKGESPPD